MTETEFPPLHVVAVSAVQRTGTRTSGKVPGDLTKPAHVVYSLGGTEDREGLEESLTVDVHTFAPDFDTAYRLAREARRELRHLAGRAEAGYLVDTVRCTTSPYPVDYENPAVVRLVGTYRITARAQ